MPRGKYPRTLETRKRMSDAKKRSPSPNLFKKGHTLNTGEKHWSWRGGISIKPYPKEFSLELRLRIRTRDKFTCLLCGKTEREELEELNRVLCVNHIDFDKTNCRESNLNTLCLRCNVKINRDREYWTDYFMRCDNPQ